MKIGRAMIRPAERSVVFFWKLVRVRSPERQQNLPILQAVELQWL